MATTNTLRMTFGLSTGGKKTISLVDPKNNVAADDVKDAMDYAVEKSAILVGTATLLSSDSAVIRSVTDTALF